MADLSKLTEGQRECLRRVLVRKNSKEIALELGISPHTVDQRLRVAIQTLGVTSRFEAARRLADLESASVPYQPVLYQPSSLAVPDLLPDVSSHQEEVDEDEGAESQPQQLGGLPEAILPNSIRPPFDLRLPSKRGGRNDLSMWARAGWILAFASGTAVAFGTFLTGIKALTDLATGSG